MGAHDRWSEYRVRSAAAVAWIAAGAAAGQPVLLAPPNSDGRGLHGWAVAGLPDVTGDGRGDIAVGAIGARAQGSYGGVVQVYSGASGVHVRTISSPIHEHHGRFGWSVSAVPDANGDGWADLAVGAPREQFNTPEDSGRAYIYSGRTGQLLRKLRSPGEEVSGWFGCALAGIGDVNGDNRGDVIVGAHHEDPGTAPENCGRVYVYSGATGARLRTLASPSPLAFEQFGYAVAAVPDVNGDARPDIAVGAPQLETHDLSLFVEVRRTDGPGRVYLFSGASGQLLRTLVSTAPQAAGFGRAVAGVPDVNGDGRGDLLVGAPLFDVPGKADAGRAYLFSGATGGALRLVASPTPEVAGFFGFSVAGTPDVNGDDRGDLLIGARGDGSAGRAYVISGLTGAVLRNVGSASVLSASFGAAVAVVPDGNGNGRADFVVGAPHAELLFWQGDFEGRAYLYRN